LFIGASTFHFSKICFNVSLVGARKLVQFGYSA